MNLVKYLVCLLGLSLGSVGVAEDEESSAKVGPDQAVLAADANKGISLSPEATKNLEIKTTRVQGPAPWEVPISAQLLTGEETNVFRLRDGYYKRIDFIERKRANKVIWITSPDLNAGDEVVVSGVALLRISELAAFGEAPGEHSH